MKIKLAQDSAPARFAAEELSKYAFMMMGGTAWEIENCKFVKDSESDTIRLGLLSDFDLNDEDVQDALIEDVIDIDIKEGSGYIAGSNPRSILMGVYKYLKSAGCMWVRPGVEGEYIPKKDISNHSYTYRKKADYPFRGESSVGALSYESMRDMIYWMPKVGMNMLLNEGEYPFRYMHIWYAHITNTHLREKGYTANHNVMKQYMQRVELDMQKTGIQNHNMGHGWMFDGLGVEIGHNHNYKVNIKEEDKKYLALTKDHGDPTDPNAKRDIAWKSVFYTNFCYSNPEGRKKLVDFWVRYAKEKPYIDYFHGWLGDSRTTGCICENCLKEEFSDWYVLLLNEIDEALTKEGINARFVFIMYVYTHRPPRKLKLNNPDRFLLLYACGINYGEGYKLEKFDGEEPAYNPELSVVPTQALGAKWRQDWKTINGIKSSLLFEYRFYTDHFCDPGYMQISREVHRDMPVLSKLEYSGNMSCQTMKCYLPTGLPMCIMAETLFDTGVDFDSYSREYFEAAFGEDGEKCREYLEKLTELFMPDLIRNCKTKLTLADGFTDEEMYKKRLYNNPFAAESFEKIPDTVKAFMPIIEKNRKNDDICRAKSWDYLKYHAYIVTELSKAYYQAAVGDKDAATDIYLKLVDWISLREIEIAPVFDLHLFNLSIAGKLGINNRELLEGLA